MNDTRQIQRKEQIMDAALKVIISKGYENSRMDDIVDLSSMSKGAIYWYYKSKKEVYLNLVNYWVIKYSTVINHIVEEDDSAADQLKDVFDYFILQYEQDPSAFKALVEFWSLAGRDEDFHKKVDRVYTKFLEFLERIINKGVKSGEFKNLDVRVTALSIMVNIEGIIWFTLFDAHGLSAREYIKTITNFILSGLINKSSGKGSVNEFSNK
jgi:AcrR family transcriptional regulator|tara:strand:+ start:294 stop:926 length:633 start_codon:yes stop_codon:yes gene_type:complete